MCQQFPDETETVNTARTASELPTVFPSAGYTFNDAERREEFVTCAENGRSYVHRTCMIKAKEALCSGLLETCESVTYALPEGANPPAGYPCNAIP